MLSPEEVKSFKEALKEKYSNFESIEDTRNDESGLYLTAEEKSGNVEYLRFKIDGKLFVQKNGKWSRVEGFLYN